MALLVLLILFCITLLAVPAHAARPVLYESPRALAMGGAFVAIADDYQSIFSNPAGLGLIDKSSFSVLNAFWAIDKDYDSLNSKISRLSNEDTPVARGQNYDNLSQMMGKTGYRNWSNLAYYLGGKGFATSIYYTETEKFSMGNPTSPFLSGEIDKDTVLTGTLARSFKDAETMFQDRAFGWWGTTLKFVSRRSSTANYNVRDFSALESGLIKDANLSGATLDFDLGALWQLNNPLKPSLGLFVGNVLESKFSEEIGSLQRHYSAGISIKPLTGPPERNERLVFALDYHYAGAEQATFTRVRAGMQAKLSDKLKLLAGIRSGYLTGGFAFEWKGVNIQAATYSDELGKRPGDKEDRRYAGSINIVF